jgi:hypothetical protein
MARTVDLEERASILIKSEETPKTHRIKESSTTSTSLPDSDSGKRGTSIKMKDKLIMIRAIPMISMRHHLMRCFLVNRNMINPPKR